MQLMLPIVPEAPPHVIVLPKQLLLPTVVVALRPAHEYLSVQLSSPIVPLAATQERLPLQLL
jgi:hypothetical protein